MQNPAPAGCAYDTATDDQLIANCNPWANRKAGDFMILWDQQGGSKYLYLRTWSGTAPNLTLGAPTLLNASVSQAQYSPDGFRGEAAVDLTATIFGGSTACKTFANTIPSTVTGNSDTADYKDTILKNAPPITNCESTTVTTPKDGAGANIPAGGLSIGTGVVAVKDSALVGLTGGTATPAGSVAFSLCKVDAPGLCTSGGTPVGSTNLTGAAYPATVVSPTAYVTSAGRYCWRAVFNGDPANGITGASDSSATECFTVNPVTPTLSTTGQCRRHARQPRDGLGRPRRNRHPAGQPSHQHVRHGRRGSRGRDYLQAVRAGQLHNRGVHVSDGRGQRQRHLQHSGATVRADRRRHLQLGRRLQRQPAEHQRRHPQRRLRRQQRGRRRHDSALVDDHRTGLGPE
jgi:hypothetical protein